jgi:hypothetical protein
MKLGNLLLCAQIAVPASLAQEQVAKLAPEGSPVHMRHTGLAGGQVPSAREYREQRYALRDRDAAVDVIKSMEESLSKGSQHK